MILARTDIHAVFVDFCHNAGTRGMHVGRYVLMPDHIHLFVRSEIEGLSLSEWVKSLKNTLSKAWRTAGEAGPYWQKGFFDHVLRSEDSYEQKWSYVVANPVRAGLVNAADDWHYQGVMEELGSPRRS